MTYTKLDDALFRILSRVADGSLEGDDAVALIKSVCLKAVISEIKELA